MGKIIRNNIDYSPALSSNANDIIYDNSSSGLTAENAQDAIDELANSVYILPPATETSLGGIKVGANLSITSDGTLSATGGAGGGTASDITYDNSTSGMTASNVQDAIDELKSEEYVLPQATSDVLGGIKVGTNLSINSSTGVLSATDTKNTAGAGASDKKLFLVGTTSQATGTSYSKSACYMGTDNCLYSNNSKVLTEVPVASDTVLGGVKQGSNVTIAADGTISTTAYSLPTATTSRLGGIKVGANLTVSSGVLSAPAPYTLPIASDAVLGGIKVGTNLSIDSTTGVLSATDTKNSAGATQKASTKLFLVGTTSQAAGTSYSNSKCYVGTDNCLYSNSKKVLVSDSTTIIFITFTTTKAFSCPANGAVEVTFGSVSSEFSSAKQYCGLINFNVPLGLTLGAMRIDQGGYPGYPILTYHNPTSAAINIPKGTGMIMAALG